jgi:hypothetical protein
MPSIVVRGLSRRGFRVSQDKRVNYATSTLVDLENYPEARILSGRQGDYYSVPELEIEFPVEGGLTTGVKGQLVVPRDATVTKIVGTVGIAPTNTDPILVDVLKVSAGGQTTDSGTTILASPLTIAVGETIGTVTPNHDVVTGDILKFNITQVGNTVAGSHLRLVVTLG